LIRGNQRTRTDDRSVAADDMDDQSGATLAPGLFVSLRHDLSEASRLWRTASPLNSHQASTSSFDVLTAGLTDSGVTPDLLDGRRAGRTNLSSYCRPSSGPADEGEPIE
jgi:hypothetical protein